MTKVLAVTLTWLLAVMVAAAIVLAGGDSAALVSPPEAVGEAFVAELITGRAQQAMRYVDPASVSPATVRRAAATLHARSGRAVPNDAEGESSVIRGERATAIVRVDGRSGRFEVSVTLTRRRDGNWRVSGWQ